MTFCVAAKVNSGLVGLADTRIVRGSEQTSKSKVAYLNHPAGSLFFMTSGLRSVRDKTSIYFEMELACQEGQQNTHLFQIANLFGNCANLRPDLRQFPQCSYSPLTYHDATPLACRLYIVLSGER